MSYMEAVLTQPPFGSKLLCFQKRLDDLFRSLP